MVTCDGKRPDMNRSACDVVVIGGGLAGLAAGARAAMAGRKAIVLEASGEARYPCNSRIATGVFHVAFESPAAETAAIAARMRAAIGDVADTALARALAHDALRAIRWLGATAGVEFVRGDAGPAYEFVAAPSAVGRLDRRWQGRGPDLLLQGLERALAGRGGELRRGHRATRLRMSGERCVGLAGEDFEIDAPAVVIADGGFQADPELLRRAISPAPERLVQRNARTGRGDGLRMAEEAGAAITGLRDFYGHVLSRDALANDTLWPYPWTDELARAAIVVGTDGRRFVDEGLGGVFIANRIAALADPASATIVCDRAGWEGPGAERYTAPNPALVEAGGTVHRADTLAALAALAGIDAGGLAREVAAYNAALERGAPGGITPPRTTSAFRAWPIVAPPFYAVPVCAGITYTLNGVAIDEWSRALDRNGRVVPGLYAAGSTTGGLEGGERVGYVGGLCKAAVTGLRAGEHIAGAPGV
jgi:fumarate reductase flavoprotein subunit